MEMDHVIIELCYKGKILQMNYRKMTIAWSFSYNFFGIFLGGATLLLYPNLCYIEGCYKGTAQYLGLEARKTVIGGLQKTKAQTSLRAV